MREAIRERGFRAQVNDVTHDVGVLSLQGHKHIHQISNE
jgi:hypothetical protein